LGHYEDKIQYKVSWKTLRQPNILPKRAILGITWGHNAMLKWGNLGDNMGTKDSRKCSGDFGAAMFNGIYILHIALI
jgi:hypothetical protein